VLILRFRVQSIEDISNETSKERLWRLNKQLEEELERQGEESARQKSYLHQIDHFVKDIALDISKQSVSLKPASTYPSQAPSSSEPQRPTRQPSTESFGPSIDESRKVRAVSPFG
jgi:hypothetical protein